MLASVKRGPGHSRPIDIVEVPATRPDPRSVDPQATQKISRAQLDEALKRTKSGTRRALRSQPDFDDETARARDSLPGPRDDEDLRSEDSPHEAPQVTIVRIDSIELEPIDPLSLPPIRSTPMNAMIMSPLEMRVIPTARTGTPLVDRKHGPRRSFWATERLHITPRTAFIAALALALFVLLAASVGFFAGRIVPGTR